MGTIGLAKALAMLRQELAQAQDEGEGHQFRFEITEAEAEFLIEIDTEGSGTIPASCCQIQRLGVVRGTGRRPRRPWSR